VGWQGWMAAEASPWCNGRNGQAHYCCRVDIPRAALAPPLGTHTRTRHPGLFARLLPHQTTHQLQPTELQSPPTFLAASRSVQRQLLSAQGGCFPQPDARGGAQHTPAPHPGHRPAPRGRGRPGKLIWHLATPQLALPHPTLPTAAIWALRANPHRYLRWPTLRPILLAPDAHCAYLATLQPMYGYVMPWYEHGSLSGLIHATCHR